MDRRPRAHALACRCRCAPRTRAGGGAGAGAAAAPPPARALHRGRGAARRVARRAGSCASGARAARRRAPGCRAGCGAPSSGSAPPTSSSARSSRRARGCFRPSWSRSSSAAATRCRPSRSRWFAASSRRTSGAPLERDLRAFDERALAAASIAQVHAAPLRRRRGRGGEGAAPAVAQLVRRDIEAMAWIAPLLVGRIPVAALANPPALVELFAETIVEELDFRLEAQNMLDIARAAARGRPDASSSCRGRIPTLVTPRVLVMERLHGFKYDDVEGMRAAGVDTAELVRALLIAFLEGAMIYGVFHGDLHGGNLFVHARRARRALRLRHHRPHERAAAPGVPAHDDDRRGERHPRPARGVPRSRRAAARRRPRRR